MTVCCRWPLTGRNQKQLEEHSRSVYRYVRYIFKIPLLKMFFSVALSFKSGTTCLRSVGLMIVGRQLRTSSHSSILSLSSSLGVRSMHIWLDTFSDTLHLTLHLSNSLSIYLFIYLSFHLSASISVFVNLSLHLLNSGKHSCFLFYVLRADLSKDMLNVTRRVVIVFGL